jgi:hypothetical protein
MLGFDMSKECRIALIIFSTRTMIKELLFGALEGSEILMVHNSK